MFYLKLLDGISLKFESISDIKVDKLTREDFFISLFRECRFSGFCKRYYSVAEHSIYCALEAFNRNYSFQDAKSCFIHDFEECLMKDLPTPFKRVCPTYTQNINILGEKIYTSLGCTGSKVKTKEIDWDMFCIEDKHLTFKNYDVLPDPNIEITDRHILKRLKMTEEETYNLDFKETIRREFMQL